MKTISEKVLAKIKKDRIAPLPAWQFKVRDGSRWLAFVLLISMAAITIGLLQFFWADSAVMFNGQRGLGLFFGRMPVIFIMIAILGGLLAFWDFKSTGQGYRYPVVPVVVSLLIVAVVAGWLFNYLGLSRNVDSVVSRFPFYQNQAQYMVSVWQLPAEGRLVGEITSIESNNNFTLKDAEGKFWSVASIGAVWRHDLKPVTGLQIKMIGAQIGSNGFEAKDIRPFAPMGGGCGMAPVNHGNCMMRR